MLDEASWHTAGKLPPQQPWKREHGNKMVSVKQYVSAAKVGLDDGETISPGALYTV